LGFFRKIYFLFNFFPPRILKKKIQKNNKINTQKNNDSVQRLQLPNDRMEKLLQQKNFKVVSSFFIF